MRLGEKTPVVTAQQPPSRRRRLVIWWELTHTPEPVECRPGCPNAWDQLGSCAECRQVEMDDRAAW